MSTLGRAVALTEPERRAVAVGEHLHLDVAGPGEVALDVALAAPEVAERLALGALQGGRGLARGR